jgi:hypothetical protein
MPSTPFIGVRISWLREARNAAFALTSAVLAAKARLALTRSSFMLRKRSPSAMFSTVPETTANPSKVKTSH